MLKLSLVAFVALLISAPSVAHESDLSQAWANLWHWDSASDSPISAAEEEELQEMLDEKAEEIDEETLEALEAQVEQLSEIERMSRKHVEALEMKASEQAEIQKQDPALVDLMRSELRNSTALRTNNKRRAAHVSLWGGLAGGSYLSLKAYQKLGNWKDPRAKAVIEYCNNDPKVKRAKTEMAKFNREMKTINRATGKTLYAELEAAARVANQQVALFEINPKPFIDPKYIVAVEKAEAALESQKAFLKGFEGTGKTNFEMGVKTASHELEVARSAYQDAIKNARKALHQAQSSAIAHRSQAHYLKANLAKARSAATFRYAKLYPGFIKAVGVAGGVAVIYLTSGIAMNWAADLDSPEIDKRLSYALLKSEDLPEFMQEIPTKAGKIIESISEAQEGVEWVPPSQKL